MAEKKLNGVLYRVEPMLATDAIRMQVRIVKMLGSAVDRLPDIFNNRKDNEEKSNAAMIAAFTDIFSKADPDEMTQLFKEIAELAQKRSPSGSHDPVDIDADFSGDLLTMMDLIIWVLREQFGSFFIGLLARGGPKNKAKA